MILQEVQDLTWCPPCPLMSVIRLVCHRNGIQVYPIVFHKCDKIIQMLCILSVFVMFQTLCFRIPIAIEGLCQFAWRIPRSCKNNSTFCYSSFCSRNFLVPVPAVRINPDSKNRKSQLIVTITKCCLSLGRCQVSRPSWVIHSTKSSYLLILRIQIDHRITSCFCLRRLNWKYTDYHSN